ncbi:hypothetical protein KCV04_g51, partial [Aureobasidium melanogenum]
LPCHPRQYLPTRHHCSLPAPAKHRRASPKQCSASFPDDGASEASFVTFRCVLTSGAAVAGREAAATLARIVVRFLPLVGACKTSEAVYLVCQRAMEKPLRVATAKVVPVATSQKSPTLMGLVCARDRFGPRPTTYHDNSISI